MTPAEVQMLRWCENHSGANFDDVMGREWLTDDPLGTVRSLIKRLLLRNDRDSVLGEYHVTALGTAALHRIDLGLMPGLEVSDRATDRVSREARPLTPAQAEMLQWFEAHPGTRYEDLWVRSWLTDEPIAMAKSLRNAGLIKSDRDWILSGYYITALGTAALQRATRFPTKIADVAELVHPRFSPEPEHGAPDLGRSEPDPEKIVGSVLPPLKMTAQARGVPYHEWLRAGWTDDLLISNGYAEPGPKHWGPESSGRQVPAELEVRAGEWLSPGAPPTTAGLIGMWVPATMSKLLPAVFDELAKALDKFPMWPNDPIHAAAIVQEEAGELVQACLEQTYEPDKGRADPHKEAIQTIVVALRFLRSWGAYDFAKADMQ